MSCICQNIQDSLIYEHILLKDSYVTINLINIIWFVTFVGFCNLSICGDVFVYRSVKLERVCCQNQYSLAGLFCFLAFVTAVRWLEADRSAPPGSCLYILGLTC